jgi:hypothetical protein
MKKIDCESFTLFDTTYVSFQNFIFYLLIHVYATESFIRLKLRLLNSIQLIKIPSRMQMLFLQRDNIYITNIIKIAHASQGNSAY